MSSRTGLARIRSPETQIDIPMEKVFDVTATEALAI